MFVNGSSMTSSKMASFRRPLSTLLQEKRNRLSVDGLAAVVWLIVSPVSRVHSDRVFAGGTYEPTAAPFSQGEEPLACLPAGNTERSRGPLRAGRGNGARDRPWFVATTGFLKRPTAPLTSPVRASLTEAVVLLTSHFARARLQHSHHSMSTAARSDTRCFLLSLELSAPEHHCSQ